MIYRFVLCCFLFCFGIKEKIASYFDHTFLNSNYSLAHVYHRFAYMRCCIVWCIENTPCAQIWYDFLLDAIITFVRQT